MSGLPATTTRREFVRLAGGLDLVTPELALEPGKLRASLNYECNLFGGYSRISGYERYDGRPSPSNQGFLSVPVSGGPMPEVGATVTGADSAATGVMIGVDAGQLYLAKFSGQFIEGEEIAPGVVVSGPPVTDDAPDPAPLTVAAQNLWREDIGAVPGEGPINGVLICKAGVYAIRDRAMYRASSAGWVLVPLGWEIPFTTGTSEIFAGNTITGGTSGATATVVRVVRRTGSWDSDAQGTLIVEPLTGTFVAGETLLVGASPVAIAPVGAVEITLPEGGRYSFDIHDFAGQTRAYGVSGAGPAFEFDGEVFVPIHTGMVEDKPTHVAVFQNHLVLSFGSSIQHSAINDPYNWSPLLGAAELNVGSRVTGLKRQPGAEGGGALAVTTETRVFVLYGTSAADWQLVSLQDDMGALDGSVQNMGVALMLSPRGVTFIGQSQAYGNFEHSVISNMISPWLQQRARGAVQSCTVARKNQYRIFFPTGDALYVTIAGREVVGMATVTLPAVPLCVAFDDDRVFFGADNGFVYQLDVGMSFDGAPIPSYLELPFNASRSLRARKRYRRLLFEITGSTAVEFLVSTEFSMGDSAGAGYDARRMLANEPFWDRATWDAFSWDGRSASPLRIPIEGSGDSMSLFLYNDSAVLPTWDIRSMIIEYSMRRGER